MAMSRDEIFEEVKEVLIDALGLDDDEVTAEATLMGDLGAESIDFLDIVFRLEKAFDIKVPREGIRKRRQANRNGFGGVERQDAAHRFDRV
jgi:acyl carrier protein